MRLLRVTRESPVLTDVTEQEMAALEQVGVECVGGAWHVRRYHRVRLAVEAVTAGADIEDAVRYLTWKDFESFVAEVLRLNDYECLESFRERGREDRPGMEIDVVGVRDNTVLAIDAKMWGVRGGKASALRQAVERQVLRAQRLATHLDRLADRLPLAPQETYHVLPVVVTWLTEDLYVHDGVPVVPVFRLNSFVLELDAHSYELLTFSGTTGGTTGPVAGP